MSCPFHSDLRDYDCHVENSSEVLSERTRSMSILLQESEKAVAKGELSRNHTVATLQCSGLHSSIQVNLLYSEKMYNVFTNKTNVKYTLQSLKVITDPDESVSTAHRNYSAAKVQRWTLEPPDGFHACVSKYRLKSILFLQTEKSKRNKSSAQ
ncbi:hypothetical protein KIL84_000415 [Mauremys mutica]|uniref:Uncharacterized protein n=1 Tax=Mauremys mutica TaxID=74926 RepID=A0A9D4B3D9_9SAUR|nr:hypothetical protein KIL84_000415 [Mauremys mutica]